jgi:centromeric protein E
LGFLNSLFFRSHIPYRDSKLTRILQNSLGGNGKTAIICAITPATEFYEETLSTLKFANRAKSVKMEHKINESFIPEKQLILRLREENSELKSKIAELNNHHLAEPSTDASKKRFSFSSSFLII